MIDKLAVPPTMLSPNVEVDRLGFGDTSELEPLEETIGQERAVEALEFGLRMQSAGFNIYVSGLSGSGKWLPEYAMGALSETGAIFLNPDAERIINAGIWSRVHLAGTIQAQRGGITRRQTLYRSGRPLPSLSDRSVLLVDDGVATGSTFLASIKALRGLNVQRLIAALPVGPVDTLSEISRTVDELVVLLAPEPFLAVGNHYEDFTQVEDEEVIRYLASAADGLRDRKHHAHA